MAYGGGIFLPSEQAYKDPNRFRDVLEAEGSKQAKYLASMDQFYAQLEEMTRQFDVTAEFKERVFEEEMAFRGEELEWKSAESELDRALQRWTVGEEVGVRREGIEAQSQYQAGLLDVERQKAEGATGLFGLEREKLELKQQESLFMRDIRTKEEGRAQETHETAKSLVTGGESDKPSYYDVGPSAYDPYGDEGFYDWTERQGGY